MARLKEVTVNPFEETRIAGDVGITPHQRVQQERDLRIHDAANLYRGSDWRPSGDDYAFGSKFVDYNYPPVFGDLTQGESGHPFIGGFGPQHMYHRDPPEDFNPGKHLMQKIFYGAAPAYRNMIGFETPDWVDQYIDRDVPEEIGDQANLWQTWQTIRDRLGEDVANEWLSSQQPVAANRGGLMSLV